MNDTANHLFAIATIAAVVAGPVLAVMVTRLMDSHRETRRRQWDIFRNLMRYRRTPLHPDFVGALNLVEVEFAKNTKVIQAWKQLLSCFEGVSNVSSQEQMLPIGKRLDQAQAILLDAIAKHLGIHIEQLDIYSGGYSPKGWFDQEDEQTMIRRLFSEIAAGKRAFPIVAFPPPMHQPHNEQRAPLRDESPP